MAFGFFKRREQRESAIPQNATESSSLPYFARSDAPVVGGQIGGGGPVGFDLGAFGVGGNVSGLEAVGGLAGLGAMLQQAAAQGNVQVTQESQTIDTRGSGELRDEIVGIMKQHGIDPDSGAAQNVDASAYGDMQRQMLEALQRHGIDLGAAGGAQIQIQGDGAVD